MKKELITHFSFMIAFFIFISLYKGWFAASYLPFWFGGILGTLLPDLDHLIYIYYLRPQELTSQRATNLLSKQEVRKALNLLTITRTERTNLVFHTTYFQILFLIFTFLVVTSTGSLLGRGLVLAFSLHLLIDQVVDLMETGRLVTWFKELPAKLEATQMRWYLVIVTVILLIFGLFF